MAYSPANYHRPGRVYPRTGTREPFVAAVRRGRMAWQWSIPVTASVFTHGLTGTLALSEKRGILASQDKVGTLASADKKGYLTGIG